MIEQLISQVNAKSKEIKDIKNSDWKTCCSIDFNGKTNLHVENDVSKLISILAYLELINEKALKLSKELDLGIKDITIQGYVFKDWKHDITLRINKIRIKQKQDQLDKMQARLDDILSPEQKRKFEIERIKKEMESL